ncbi:hypothetical protein PFISCL1PPCAC_6167 [Pristionchus fissidentatus]|uniref:Translation initiation factor eIF2B subunit epsilon n=1 Tax=Pristionchus fissidentatus TaxID=1538716 RepID=A0AAV5V5K3_9BILA|nr:hypothetical protein PFISCL1PPCAC_6167 [Pristionchus fissidentatus]
MPPKDDSKNQDNQRLAAVILAESFEPRFNAITSSKSFGEIEICNVRAIDYSLRWISHCDIANVVIVTSEKNAYAYQNTESSWKGIFDSVTVVICQNAQSIGDALREVESRNVVSGHFLLIPSPVSFCSSTLQNQIKAFKQRFKKDRNAVMSLIYCESRVDGTTVAVNENGRMVAFHSQSDPSKLDSEQNEFGDSVKVRKDVIDTGISICSLQALAHFTDNFDFQTRDEVIRHILVNEDIMLQYVNVEVLPPFESAVSVFDYCGLIRSNGQLISRWFHPIQPLKKNSTLLFNSGNIITSGRQRVRVDGWNAFIGEEVTLGLRAFLVSSSIGNKSNIGSSARLIDCLVSDGCSIGDEINLEQVFLAENVTIAKGQIIPKNVVIGPNVKLDGSITIPEGSLIACCAPDEDMEDVVESTKLADGVYSWRVKNGCDWWKGEWIGKEEDDEDVNNEVKVVKEGEEEEDEEEEYDVEKIFTDEVYDSLHASLGLDKISNETVKKMIVEINSSKIAYNITMDRVATLLFVAFLRLPNSNNSFATLKQRIDNYTGLFKNYYAKTESQYSLLEGMNEHLTACPSFSPLVAKTVHYLWDSELVSEEVILEWNSDVMEEDKEAKILALVKNVIEFLQQSDDEDDEEEEE